MNENLLHFLWHTRRFDQSNLRSTRGDDIKIIHPGEYNSHAGPDFQNARIKIGNTLWAGNVEIHLKSSDWLQHGHQKDKAYGNVVLHVVLEEDTPIVIKRGQELPCLELKNRIAPSILTTYRRLMASQLWIPCQNQFNEVPELIKKLWYDRLLAERLEKKSADIQSVLAQNQNNWEETFYQFIARNFGLKVNSQPFEMLARMLPQTILARNRNNPTAIESLLFGVAGFLEGDFSDEYPTQLKKEFRILKQKYGLSSLQASLWKFMRLHPANFPTIRLAQFAKLIQKSTHLFSHILETENFEDIRKLLVLQTGQYWETHFQFDKASPKSDKKLGTSTIQLIAINTIAPFLFLYGKMQGNDSFKERALHLMETIPGEKNKIIVGWQNLGEIPKSAASSQALLQLKNEYCDKRRCLECAIGASILKA